MVDIIIGQVQPIGPPVKKTDTNSISVEAEILNVRPPRKQITRPAGEERRKQFRQDPHNGQVLTLLVPNGMTLPKDLDGKKYKVVMRIVKKT
ncbi:hypothetical protein [Desulfogranum marinum]|jgi:hypothetical protein|uniref:hypothetical protein n=1 Tax=Desulfogranum marinum TaxID=453220 RepID=UPI00196621A0|nr:hypothetical protein [Desulfogranum marinum]MBM9511333.1 hypothetical protein [Desulfogranum marinum]